MLKYIKQYDQNADKKRVIQIVVMTFFLIGLLFFVRHDFDTSGETIYEGNEYNIDGKSLTNEVTYVQNIVSKGTLQQIDILLEKEQKGEVFVQVVNCENNKVLFEGLTNVSNGEKKNRIEIPLEQDVLVAEQVRLILRGMETTDQDAVVPVLCRDGRLEKASVEGVEADGYLAVSLHYAKNFRVGYFLMALLALICIMILLFLPYMQRRSPEKIFAFLAIIFGIAFVFINPPLQNPDEYYHFQKSIDVSYGNLSPFYLRTDKDIYTLTGPEAIMDSKQFTIYEYTMDSDLYKKKLENMSMHENLISVKSTGGFHPFVGYIPQAIAVLLARLMHLNVLYTMYLVRAINAILYAILVSWSIKKIPIGKNILMALSLTPIAISQAASASTDGLCNALVFLLLAFILDYSFTKEKELGIREVIPLALILLLLAFCKYLYAVAGVLVFLIPKEKFGTTKKYWKTFLVVAVPLAVLLVAYYSFVAGNLIETTTYNKGVNPGKQLSFAITHIKHIVLVFLNTINNMIPIYVEQFNTLGALNYKLGILIPVVPIFLTGVFLTDVSEEYQISFKQRIILLITGIGIILLVMFSMYLVWSKVGAGIIEGVQARYFIPALPLLFLGLQIPHIRNENKNYTAKVASFSVLWLFLAIVYMTKMCY